MEKDLNDSVVQNTSCLKESESDKSFVGKVKSIINNTPLSKWFRKQDDNRPVIRRRDEVFSDEDVSEIQPPSKRKKLPIGDEGSNFNNTLFNEKCVTTANNVSNNMFNKIPEPVAGPSGIKSHKLLKSATLTSSSNVRNTFSSNELLNGHSDSEESTSGYSSVARIGSKEQVCGSQESSKQTSPLQSSPSNSRSLFHKSSATSNRSLFAESSLSPNRNTSLSMRRPSFNASTFGSPNFVDKTISTKRVINSPFYNGRTIYGGASAYGRSLRKSPQELKTALRKSVQIKPVNKTTENGNLVLGKTARRILDTIEQYSSPINDAKKIPVVSRKDRQGGLLTKYAGANPYMLRETKVSSNRELQVPTVPDLLRMKTRLQESTENVRQIATSSKSDLNTECYKIHTTEDEKEKHTGKIKAKVTSVRQKNVNNEIINEVNLTPVSLPITTLPTFDFVVPPPLSTKSIIDNSSQISKTTQPTYNSNKPKAQPSPKPTQTEINVQKEKQTTTTTITEYKFSDPLIVSENIKSIVAINNFKFSEPLCTKNKSDISTNVTLNFKMPENKLPNLLPNKKTNCEMVKTARTLKIGSVMDILGKKDGPKEDPLLEKFKPAQGTWECSVCMIRNQADKTRCVACETPKTGSAKPAENKNTFGSQFKMSSDKWECSSCMVHNNIIDSKCVSCTTPKSNASSGAKSSSVTGAISGFGDKFKPSGNTWECSTCMIRNKSELTKCAACETPNPKATSTEKQLPSVGNREKPSIIINQQSGFGNAFKVKSDEWECATCMIRNKASNTKCQCCETPNPKSAPASTSALGIVNDKKPISSFNFGIDKAATTSFNFGIPPNAASQPETGTKATSIFGENSKPPSNGPVQYSFGIPPPAPDKPKTTEPLSVSSTDPSKPKEIIPVLNSSNPLLKPNEKLPEQTETAAVGFKFDVSSSVTTPVTTASVSKSDITTLTTSTPVNKPLFNFKPTTPLFGNKLDKTEKPTAPVTTAGKFTFGTKPAVVAAPLVSTIQTTQPEHAKPVFKFSSATEKPSFGVANSAATSLNNGFGSTNTPSFGMSNTVSFDKPATNSTNVKPFTFSSATKEASEPASKVPMFSFGQSATSAAPTTIKSSGFNFGSTTAPTFNFTGGKTENTFNTPPANMFGGSSSTTAQNGTFNFGSTVASNNTQKAGFSFGATVNNTVASGPQPGLNLPSFGAPAGGFNFSEAASTFNTAAKPSFNFSDGNVMAFSAQPSTDTGTAAPRKIKRAVRRTQR